MKKMLKRTGLIVLCLVLAVAVISTILFRNELRSLYSLRKVDEYGMFQMTYYGDYGFDDFLKTGATSDNDIESFVTKRLLKGLPIDLGITGDGCTAFVTRNNYGEIIYGRNFDFTYAPSLQVFTNPNNGYASVSTVNLSFAGYGRDNLPEGLSFNSFLTLSAPYLPFDGINEKGVAIALLAVPKADYSSDPDKITLNTTTAIRLVLDKAATVDEAVQLLSNYNIYFSGGIDCHYLIADAAGESVLLEYYDGKMQTVRPSGNYQIASNFIAYNDVNIGEGFTEFDRYNTVKAAIEKNKIGLTDEQALSLLAEVGVMDGATDKLQWSVLYNLTSGNVELFAQRNIHNIIHSQLDMNP